MYQSFLFIGFKIAKNSEKETGIRLFWFSEQPNLFLKNLNKDSG
jgi:hypothetical protein